MSTTEELDKLVLANLEDLDAASKRIDAIGDRVWRECRKELERWATERGWFGEFKESVEPWVAPVEWRVQGVEAEAWFYLEKGPDDTESFQPDEPYYWLSRYVGVAGGRLCLWLTHRATSARKWKPLAREIAPRLAPLDFRLSDSGEFYTDATLDPKHVADALADNDFDRAMWPVTNALDRAHRAQGLFGELLASARAS